MLSDFGKKIKARFSEWKEELYLILVIVLVAFLSFGLGRLSVIYGEKGGIEILYPKNQAAAALVPLLEEGGEGYVASRTGTAYYFPWCGAVNRIKESNRIYFKSRSAAEAAGYKSGNCSGL